MIICMQLAKQLNQKELMNPSKYMEKISKHQESEMTNKCIKQNYCYSMIQFNLLYVLLIIVR
jgi:hypothetical protein